ncbi:hypothetical protein LCGC14_3097880, partial [marine sediment metagenome]
QAHVRCGAGDDEIELGTCARIDDKTKQTH